MTSSETSQTQQLSMHLQCVPGCLLTPDKILSRNCLSHPHYTTSSSSPIASYHPSTNPSFSTVPTTANSSGSVTAATSSPALTTSESLLLLHHHPHHHNQAEYVINNNNTTTKPVLTNHNNNDTSNVGGGGLIISSSPSSGSTNSLSSSSSSSTSTYLSCCSSLNLVNGQSPSLKLSDNHLSTKLVRNSVAPYGVVRAHHQHHQQHQQVVAGLKVGDETGDQVAAAASATAVVDQCGNNNPVVVVSSMGSTANPVGVPAAGLVCVPPNMLKLEPNGNSIEINSVDNQLHPAIHLNHHLHQHHQTNGGTPGGSSCCTPTSHLHHTPPPPPHNNHGPINHFGTTTPQPTPPPYQNQNQTGHVPENNCDVEKACNGGEPMESSGSMSTNPPPPSCPSNHCSHTASSSNTNGNTLSPLLTSSPGMTSMSSSCSHNGSSSNAIAINGGNGPSTGNNMSPGENDDEHDCDDDKVINGDTFGAAGELPDPDSIKMFVGQIPKHMNETDLRELFEKYGRVYQINVLRDKATKQSKGCCFVTFFTRKAALDAQNALHNVKTLPGMNNTVQMKPADNENRYDRKLFIGMISKKLNETDVRNMFSRFGTIDECTVLRLPNGESKGCAFVTFASKQSALNAIKAVHQSITMEGCSSPIVVKFADTPKDKDQKRQSQMVTTQPNLLSTFSSSGLPSAVQQQYYSILHHHQLQQQQQPQQGGFYSQLSPLGVQGLTGIGGLGSTSATGLPGIGSPLPSTTNVDLALTTNAILSSVTQNPVAVQNLMAALGNPSLSPTGASGSSVGSGNSVANLTGNGLHSGLSSYHSALRPSAAAVNTKQLEGPEGCNLFIYHLPPEFGDADLATIFTTYGTVLSAKVFVDKHTNLSKCFGFVSFDNQVSAQMAIQAMHGFQIGTKRLKVQLKRSKSKDAAKPY